MKIALIAPMSLEQTNGASKTIKKVLKHYEAEGHDAVVWSAYPLPPGGEYAGYPVRGVPTAWFDGFSFALPKLAFPKQTIGQDIINSEPDIIHLANPMFDLGKVGIWAAKQLDVPTVSVDHTDVEQFVRRWLDQSIDTILLRPKGKGRYLFSRNIEQIVGRQMRKRFNDSDSVLAPTEAAKRRLGALGVDLEKVKIWGRGIDRDQFNPANRERASVIAQRRAWSKDGQLPIVGYIGRLAPEKQVERLAELADLPIQLVIVGDGTTKAVLEQLLGPNTIFTGELRDQELADAYASLDIFVHTGPFETYGQTIQEAKATQVPVIVPNAGGPTSTTEHGVSGLLFDIEKPGEIRRYVKELIADPDRATALALGGLESLDGLSWEDNNRQLIQEYERLISEHD